MAPSSSSQPALSYCLETVRRQDPDRFLTLLFAPADRREDLAALYAFNHEVAKTREVVTEPMLGQIRLQWWRDSIAGVYEGEARRHEVVQPLAQAVQRHGLDRALFDRLIDGREADMDDAAPADLGCLVSYAEVTSAPLVRLALDALGVERTGAVDAVAGHVGRGWALTGILRAVPFLARAHRSRLPTDLMEKSGASEAELFELKPQPGLADVARAVADAARAELAAARALRGQVPRAAIPALLPARLATVWLGRLAKAGYDPLDPVLLRPDGLRAARLAWAAVSGRW
ncbi:MAG: squalene/phytoene synthase family protein [Azospirillaceae bacterium]|nr:squalene/phytoene synthase family protein [Azospirillaceae bacterium]